MGNRPDKSPSMRLKQRPAAKLASPPTRNTTMEVYTRLRSAILRGDVKPGSSLSQVQIANRFDVGRGPLREAYRLLQQEGLVTLEVNQRAKVTPFSVSDLEELYALRIAAESLAVRISVPRFSKEDLGDIRKYLLGMEKTPRTEVQAWRKVHRAFHFSLIAKAGDRIVANIKNLYDHCERYRTIYAFPDSHAWLMVPAEHQNIADACAARNVQLAGQLLAQHLARTALTMLSVVAPNHEPQGIRDAVQMVSGSDLAR